MGGDNSLTNTAGRTPIECRPLASYEKPVAFNALRVQTVFLPPPSRRPILCPPPPAPTQGVVQQAEQYRQQFSYAHSNLIDTVSAFPLGRSKLCEVQHHLSRTSLLASFVQVTQHSLFSRRPPSSPMFTPPPSTAARKTTDAPQYLRSSTCSPRSLELRRSFPQHDEPQRQSFPPHAQQRGC